MKWWHIILVDDWLNEGFVSGGKCIDYNVNNHVSLDNFSNCSLLVHNILDSLDKNNNGGPFLHFHWTQLVEETKNSCHVLSLVQILYHLQTICWIFFNHYVSMISSVTNIIRIAKALSFHFYHCNIHIHHLWLSNFHEKNLICCHWHNIIISFTTSMCKMSIHQQHAQMSTHQ